MDVVRLEYDLDADTAVAAAVAWSASDPGRATAPLRRRNVVVGLFLAGVFAALYLLRGPAELAAVMGFVVSLIFAYVNSAGWKTRQATEHVVRRLLADPAGSAALGRRTVELTRTRLVVVTGYSREEYNWSALLRVQQTPGFLLLTLPGPRPLAIPRSAFPDGDGFDRMADDLRAATGGTV